MRLAPADLEDAQVVALLKLHAATARANTAARSAHALDLSELREPAMRVWSAWEGADLLGVGALKRLSADHAEIKSMHVAAAVRRRGVGAVILGHLLEQARAAGCTQVSLETGAWAYFEPAHALYRRFGFVECPAFEGYKEDRNSLFFRRDLAV